jgi:hypothetical protein
MIERLAICILLFASAAPAGAEPTDRHSSHQAKACQLHSEGEQQAGGRATLAYKVQCPGTSATRLEVSYDRHPQTPARIEAAAQSKLRR